MKKEKIVKIVSIVLFCMALILVGVGCYLIYYSNQKFTVSFDTGTDTTIENQIIIRNGSATEVYPPYKEGFAFDYWSYNGEFFDFATKVNNNINLVAVYNEITPDEKKYNYYQYVVSYIVEGDISLDQTFDDEYVNIGELAKEPTVTMPEGYTFIGWYYNDKPFDFSTKITADMRLTLKYN